MMKEAIAVKKQDLEKAAFILKSIAHPTRLAIIKALSERGLMAVSEISETLGLEQSLTSHHLNIMKKTF